jgi:hypothetical protein
MPIKAEDALEVMDFDLSKFDSVEDFRNAVERKFVSRETAQNDKELSGKILGKFNRVFRTKLGKIGNAIGADVDDSLEPLDILDQFIPAISNKVSEIDSWKKKAETAVADDVVKEWQSKLKSTEKERETFKQQAVEWQEKFNGLDTEVKTTKRKSIIDREWDQALSGVAFHPGVDDLKKRGFVSAAKERYRIDLDEELKPKMVDASGNPIKHPKWAGELMSLSDAVKDMAKEFKLLQDNPHAGKPVAQSFQQRPIQHSVQSAPPSQGAIRAPRRFGQR